VDRSHPGAVTPEDLVAYIDGEAPGHVAVHVRDCAICGAAADGYARAQGQLLGRLRRFDCPTSHTLGEYELDLLRPAERTEVAAHIVRCPRCTDELRQLRAFLAVGPISHTPGPLAGVRRVFASLLGPIPGVALAGLRGAVDDMPQTYLADEFTITIDAGIASRRALGSLIGLIWREGDDLARDAGGAVALVAADGTTRAAEVDALGNFGFTGVAPGTYRLEVALGDRLVVVDEIHIGRR